MISSIVPYPITYTPAVRSAGTNYRCCLCAGDVMQAMQWVTALACLRDCDTRESNAAETFLIMMFALHTYMCMCDSSMAPATSLLTDT
jgi:hypothetical protein